MESCTFVNVLMIEFKDFFILSWNVRGFASKKSNQHMHEIIMRYKPDLIFLYETRILFSKSKRFWDREGYIAVAVEEVNVHSGGIWALSNTSTQVHFQPVHTMSQCITVKISKGNSHWLCSGVYASPVNSTRLSLWSHLIDIRNSITSPWSLSGDFNEILTPLEQRGGNFCNARADKFASCLNNFDMIDMEFFGSQYTWQRRCRNYQVVSRRLDRGVCDMRWRL